MHSFSLESIGEGVCVDKDGDWKILTDTYKSDFVKCKENCRKKDGCVAVAYRTGSKYNNCKTYNGGPYVSTKPVYGKWTCYIFNEGTFLFLYLNQLLQQ